MKVIIIDDAGRLETIHCSKIEPANAAVNPETLTRQTKIIIDEGARIVDLFDVFTIID